MTNVIQNPIVITVVVMPGETGIKRVKNGDNLNLVYGKMQLDSGLMGVKENIFEKRNGVEIVMQCAK